MHKKEAMRRIRTGVGLAVIVAIALNALPAAAAPPATLIATYQAAPPASAGAGTTITVPVTLTNTGTETWSAAGPAPVRLTYHWYDGAGTVIVWDGIRTLLAADVPPGMTATVTA